MKQVTLPGINPQNVKGYVLRPTDDTEFYVVPTRGLDILSARLAGHPVLWEHPSGHRDRPCGDLDPIEGFFTAGIENTGPPVMGLPLHGSFGWRWADAMEFIETETEVGVRGVIHATDMVRGPYIDVTRTVTATRGRRGFRLEDIFAATVDSDFMLLYHPNFPVSEEARLLVNAVAVKSRDAISDRGLDSFDQFSGVHQGKAVLPPSEDAAGANAENFEQAYVMQLEPDSEGFVTAMLVSGDNQSAVTIRYGGNGFDDCQQCFVLWKNPRGGVCGMERGNTFCGRRWAKENDLVSHLQVGKNRTYVVEVDFLTSSSEIEQAILQHQLGHLTPELLASDSNLAEFYRRNPTEGNYES